MPSPFSVDVRLTPEQRGELVEFCLRPGTTVKAAMAWLSGHGVKISHGAVGNWMARRRQLIPFAFNYAGAPANVQEGRRRIASFCSRLPAEQVRMVAAFAEFLSSVDQSRQARQPGVPTPGQLSQFEGESKGG